MLAILSNSIEDAGRLSDALQHYWSAKGIYASVSLFETEEELMAAMGRRRYQRVILACADNLQGVIARLRSYSPRCKIAVLTDGGDAQSNYETALLCRRLAVELMLTRADLERPLEHLSKQLCIL